MQRSASPVTLFLGTEAWRKGPDPRAKGVITTTVVLNPRAPRLQKMSGKCFGLSGAKPPCRPCGGATVSTSKDQIGGSSTPTPAAAITKIN